jgi:xanthine dehydrogenase accessory factor
MASAVAWRLYAANIRSIFMMEALMPLGVRREVAFCEAVCDGIKRVEGVEAQRVSDPSEVPRVWDLGKIAVAADPDWQLIEKFRPDVVVDAILAKKNLGTRREDAHLVIGLGPGFVAGEDVHLVIETNRGHDLGRIIVSGPAEPDTGIPGAIGGVTAARLLRAPAEGEFQSACRIGDLIEAGETVGRVGDQPLTAGIRGVLRGLIRPGTRVTQGLKVGDIDPRAEIARCYTISDKARAISGSVLEAILRVYNK